MSDPQREAVRFLACCVAVGAILGALTVLPELLRGTTDG